MNEFCIGLYKRPNKWGILHKPTRNWVLFGKLKDLEKRLILLNKGL